MEQPEPDNRVASAITVILPAFNESKGLIYVLPALRSVAPGCEIIVVDDGSTDDTPDIAARHGCRVIQHPRNLGKGAAVRTGLDAARGSVAVIMDADGTYPVEAIVPIAKLLQTHELVRGTRVPVPGSMPTINKFGNWLFNALLHTADRVEGTDLLTGLFGIRLDAYAALALTAKGFDIEVEIAIKARALKLRSTHLLVPYAQRIGEKKLRPLRDGWRIFWRVCGLTLSTRRPARLFPATGFRSVSARRNSGLPLVGRAWRSTAIALGLSFLCLSLALGSTTPVVNAASSLVHGGPLSAIFSDAGSGRPGGCGSSGSYNGCRDKDEDARCATGSAYGDFECHDRDYFRCTTTGSYGGGDCHDRDHCGASGTYGDRECDSNGDVGRGSLALPLQQLLNIPQKATSGLRHP